MADIINGHLIVSDSLKIWIKILLAAVVVIGIYFVLLVLILIGLPFLGLIFSKAISIWPDEVKDVVDVNNIHLDILLPVFHTFLVKKN